MNTAKQIAYTSARPLATCMVAILLASLVQVADAQEQSKPFVLKPASPSALEAVTPAASYPTVTDQALVPQPLPAGQGSAGSLIPGTSSVPGTRVMPGTIQPGHPRPGETFYMAPDGRVVRPTHVYRGGRVYRVTPSRETTSANKKTKPQPPPRPKFDYSLAPVQPAIPPRLVPQQPPQLVRKTRVVDGAPLLRQEAVVSADRPASRKKPATHSRSATRNKPAAAPTNAPWLTGVRRLMDGNRSAPAPGPSNCPNCRKRQASAQVASKPSSRNWK